MRVRHVVKKCGDCPHLGTVPYIEQQIILPFNIKSAAQSITDNRGGIMGRLFETDGKILGFLGRTADLVLLNLLWLLCSLPVVTIGASTAAMYTVALKMARNEEDYIFRGFVRAFKRNFKQSTIIWCGILAMAALLHFDFYYIGHVSFQGSKLLFMAFVLIAFLLAAVMSYVFPILAYFENSTKKAVKNAALMAVAYFPYTVLILAVNACPF